MEAIRFNKELQGDHLLLDLDADFNEITRNWDSWRMQQLLTAIWLLEKTVEGEAVPSETRLVDIDAARSNYLGSLYSSD